MPYEDHADEEWVDDHDSGNDSEDDLLICPSCREEVHEDTQQCPYCGDWIIPVWPGEGSKKTIWIIAVALIIISFLMMTIF